MWTIAKDERKDKFMPIIKNTTASTKKEIANDMKFAVHAETITDETGIFVFFITFDFEISALILSFVASEKKFHRVIQMRRNA